MPKIIEIGQHLTKQ